MISPRIMLLMMATASLAVAETRVRITGMSGKSEAQVLAWMGGRLDHVRAAPATASLADDAAFMLRNALRKDGYVDAAVDWRLRARDEITLVVREGQRLTLGQVTVRGAANDDAARLARLFTSPANKERPFGLGPPPFRENDVGTGLANIRQELNAAGFWAAQAAVKHREIHSGTRTVNIEIEVRYGPRFTIGQPHVTSVDGRGVKLTAGAAQPFVGRPASTRHLNDMRLAAEQLAVSRGYPNSRIRMGRSLTDNQFIPEFIVDLGGRVRLNRLDITGLKITREQRIHARVDAMQGDWYDEAGMNQRMREFLATGAFQAARVETRAAGHRLVDATLHFEETRAREMSVAAGMDSYLGFISRITYANRNFLGRLYELSSGLELSSRGALGELRLTDPWLGGKEIAATLRAFALIRDREGYETYEAGIGGRLLWKHGKHYMIELAGSTSLVNLTSDGLPSEELGETVYNHTRLRLTQTLDFRDNPMLPKNGWRIDCPLEIGTAAGDLSTSYVMGGLGGGWYHEINRRYDFGVGGDIRMLVPSGDGSDLPIDLRLFNGGARSVRSFPERELGPAVNGYATGGEAMWNTNAEWIRKLGNSLRAVAFFDAGSLARNYDELGQADIELAAGLGLRLYLPIGPVRLEYGYNLTRDPGEPAGTIHFAIGMAY